MTAQNPTVDALTPHINDIKTILTGTLSSLQALVGQPTEVILASVEGTAVITVEELGKLVAGVVVVRFFCLPFV